MSMFVRMITDSISPQGIRICSLHAHYWRAIHSELMTHKDLSRNARSSRAVPSKVLLTEPIFIPQFGMNQPGMQSDILAPPELQARWAAEWEELAEITRSYVSKWTEEKMHKQHCNRPLEWFGWIDVMITAVYWENFFALRISEYAQPEFDMLAKAIQVEMHLSEPTPLQPGQWHLPWITSMDRLEHTLAVQKKLSVARSARLSYRPFDGEGDLDAELDRYHSLVVARPVHASPAEHQATPDELWPSNFIEPTRWKHPDEHGNFYGWRQLRKQIPHENVREIWDF